MPKYHVTIKCAGVNIRIKNVEAPNMDEAEVIAYKRGKESIKVVGSELVADKKPSDRPMTGDEIWKKFFG